MIAMVTVRNLFEFAVFLVKTFYGIFLCLAGQFYQISLNFSPISKKN